MQARISAAQRALLLLLVASLGVAVVARPHPENRRFTDALAELESFRASFSRADVERALREQAEAQRAQWLTPLQRYAGGTRGVKLQVAKSAPPLRPLTSVQLATLAEVRAHVAAAPSTVKTGAPELAPLGAALAWRLARTQKPGPFTVTGAELVPARVSSEDVELEREVAKLRLEQLRAQADVDDARKRLEGEEHILEARRKKHLPWKVVVKSVEATDAAKQVLEEKTRALSDVQQRYEDAVKKAEQPKQPAPAEGVPQFALARVTFESEAPLDIPVALDVRDTPVATLRRDSFPATRAAGLWDELKDQDADGAIAAVRSHFNWHNRYFELSGLKLSGAAVLQIAPSILPLMLILVLLRIRDASSSYSPFTTKVSSALPRVGFRNRALDCVVVIILPVLSAASAAASLLLIDQLPVLPAIMAVVCLLVGAYTLIKLGELQELIESILHSHSFPPEADQ